MAGPVQQRALVGSDGRTQPPPAPINQHTWQGRSKRTRRNPLLVGLFVTIGIFGCLTLISILLTPAHESVPPGRGDLRSRSGCLDHLRDCPGLAERGECTTHPEFLHVACPVACGLCSAATQPAAEACQDHAPDCERRASEGECALDKPMEYGGIHSHLRVFCPRSCGLCPPQGGGGGGGDGGGAAAEAAGQPTLGRTDSCTDRATDCAARAAAGGCTTDVAATRARMVTECAATCGTCQRRQAAAGVGAQLDAGAAARGAARQAGGAAGPCRDERRACEYWRGVGECERAPEVMRRICAVRCGASWGLGFTRNPHLTLSPCPAPHPCAGQLRCVRAERCGAHAAVGPASRVRGRG